MSADRLFQYERILEKNSTEFAKICETEAEKEADYFALKKRTDIVYAACWDNVINFENPTDRKHMAYAHEDFKNYITGLSEAKRKFLHSKAVAKAYKTRIEALITLISLNKSLIGLK